MIKKIISNLNDCRDIVLAAQNLVNEVYSSNIQLLDGVKKRGYFSSKLKIFVETIKKSDFLTEKEKLDFSKLNKKEIYKLAREIIIELIKKEIKNPLT